MKALSLSLTTRNPLMAPTIAPVANTTTIPAHTGKPNPEPPSILLSVMSQAPSIGARPTIDSRDRSILAASRTSVSAITRIESSDDCCRILTRFSSVRKAGLLSQPTKPITTSAGINVSSRNRKAVSNEASPDRRSARGPRPDCRFGAHDTTPSIEAISSRSVQSWPNALTMRPWKITRTAVTDPQFLDIVADQQHSGSLRTCALNDGEQRFLCRNIDALRRVDEDQNGRRRSERPSHDVLLLVAPAKFADRPDSIDAHTIPRIRQMRGRSSVSTFRRDQTERSSRFMIVTVRFSAIEEMREDPSS